jgi:alanyl-tRNA synthetase
MNEQKQRAKADAKAKKVGGAGLQVYSDFRSLGETIFDGYQSLTTEAKVLGLIRDGAAVDQIVEGQLAEVILDRTSLYAESGGQAADAGLIRTDNSVLEVMDVQKPVRGLFSHRVLVKSGSIAVGDKVVTEVNPHWRLGACQAHSATHVVHAALRQVLGPEALQSGSFNKPGYMRLDFAWGQALSEATKSEIEEVSNLAIRSDLAVSAQFMTLPEAKQWGAIALFGETYDESVRVVQVGGPWSRELCGGTHVSRTSQIGLVTVTGESSVGSGARRIEAEVGIDAIRSLVADRALIRRLSADLKAPASELEGRIAEVFEEQKRLTKQLEELSSKSTLGLLPALLASASDMSGKRVLAATLDQEVSPDALRQLALAARAELGEAAVVILGSVSDRKPMVISAIGSAAQAAGVNAGALVKLAASVMGGGGGGKPDLAQGGGQDAGKLAAAVASAKDSIS